MSMDNYIGIIKCKDGKWRGYDLSASQPKPSKEELESGKRSRPTFVEDNALDAIGTAQQEVTEYGYEFLDENDLKCDTYEINLKPNPNLKISKETKKYYGHPEFYKIIEELKELHSKKNYNYAAAGSPLSNFLQCEKFGVPAPYGCLVRMTDKDSRRVEVLLKGDVVGETIVDTSKDDSVYNIIFTILWKDFLKNKNAERIMKMFAEIKKLLVEGK